MSPHLAAEHVALGYDQGGVVCEDVSLPIPEGGFTAIVGPNGCGKSTLLRCLAGVLTPRAGRVVLDGRPLLRYRPKEVSRRIGLLPQSSLAPDGITVVDLVARGRIPHQGLFQQWRPSDEAAVENALRATRLLDHREEQVRELSGGQRQRVWIAMLLAQETPLLLLDEPTTYLDIAYQCEVLELLARLHAAGKTVVTVLHDLNQAARYATRMVVMKKGAIVAQGAPEEVLTESLVREVFGIDCLVSPDPVTGTPSISPRRPGLSS